MKQSGQRSASVSPTSGHTLRQTLFASLALMLTLLGAQQYHYWNQPAEPLIHTLHSMQAPALSAVSASGNQAVGLQPVEQSDQYQRPAESHWVF
ncbi:hypothetical protein [Pseudomonas massiliensis]|uniref:hypothetical protein n=1 Tax=Pseudomonas massiliensis TaxID=522492 RepID=UPI00058B0A71|nr:hypothetical protein [Pseudomonas massiliensis]